MGKEKLRVFIAEDEPLVLSGFQAMVTGLGHQVVGSAFEGHNAVSRILELRPDLVIMDINLPGISGLQAIELVNQQVRLPCIVVTGYQDPALLEQAARLGVFGFLPKPVDEYEIRSTIEITMARFAEFSQLERELCDTQTALAQRKTVERAKGILMEKMGLTEQQAMKHLQKLARDRNSKLAAVAQEIIQANSLFTL